MEVEIIRRARELQEANRLLRELQGDLEARVAARTEELEQEVAERRRTEAALRHSEDQLRQAQKLEAIGRLAGGVAHDFNNLLTAIMGYTQLAARARGSDIGPQLGEIQRAAERAAALTRQLLAFSRQQVLEPKVLDLNAVVRGLDKMLRRLIGEDIDFETAADGDIGRVRVDPGQIEQVIVNLVVNARDAMPGGGKLTIETACVELDEECLRNHHAMRPGTYVLLAVSDTGSGMSPEIKARIFEPFFTTKGLGHGTGLGLATVHGIVKQSEGHIEVYSEPGHGTTFKVYLPAVAQQVDVEPASVVEVRRLEGRESILLVEDDEAIRTVVASALRLHGYTVIEAADGSEAISRCEHGTAPIDLVVTDVVMPLMSGPEFAERATRGRPELLVLFVSGYTDRALIHQGLRLTGTAFLQKPFTPETLIHKLREMLDAPRRRAA
jgi:signal transduction histidine kinase/ActR/RegA family two-component response regulator